jgi:glucokinase
MTYDRLIVGLDIGGTTMKAGVVTDAGRLLAEPTIVSTEPEQGQTIGLRKMVNVIRDAIDAAKVDLEQIQAIGVAAPGPLDLRTGMMLEPPNLKPWRNVPVRQFIADDFQKPTAFQNDANAAAYGEWWCGAGRGAGSLVMFTLGTGIGGGIVLNGRIVEGAHSHGGELGHIKVELTNARPCGCGQRGCLEAYVSAPAIVARADEALTRSDDRSTLRNLLPLSAQAVFESAAAGDLVAEGIVDETARYLAMAAANAMHTIDPEVIVFGGGISLAGEPFLQRIRKHVSEFAFPTPAQKCRIEAAKLGAHAGIIGAAGCARHLDPDSRLHAGSLG